jgi:hypothetical protein
MAQKTWTHQEDATLIVLYNAGESASVIGGKLQRTESSVTSRISKLREMGHPVGDFRRSRKPGPEPRYVGIDQDDLAWMAHYRQQAAQRARRIPALGRGREL